MIEPTPDDTGRIEQMMRELTAGTDGWTRFQVIRPYDSDQGWTEHNILFGHGSTEWWTEAATPVYQNPA
jgi:hypothetical protein